MRIKSLYLQNFRLYDEASFTFGPGCNTIAGPNAHGKTTILEAIHLLITGSSFRTSQLTDLIRHGAEYFIVEARFDKEGMEQRIRFAYNGKEKKILYNNSPCKSSASLYGLLQGVAMTPDDVVLVKGGPSIRRQYLDLQLSQVDPLYVHFLSRYQRAMRQRNVLLKAKQEASLSAWEQEMAAAAAYLVPKREKAAKELAVTANLLQQRISGSAEQLDLTYKTPVAGGAAAAYQSIWARERERDFYLGHTSVGPHKDDLTINLSGKEARFYASEGQQRSCIASMRFAGWEQLRASSGQLPLMLIDDVGVSLDGDRKQRLLDAFDDLGQLFITTADAFTVANGTQIAV